MVFLFPAFLLLVGVVVIGALCWTWMQSTRASQARQDTHNQRVIALLEEQATLLRRIAERP